MKHIFPSIRMLIFMTGLCGIAYPLLVTTIGQGLFSGQAGGSIVQRQGTAIGSLLVAQNFQDQKYFWPRPSGASFNPLPSSGSNLGPTSADLKKAYEERKAALKSSHPNMGEPPQDLLFASGSGLDPEISPQAAAYQMSRVATARGLTSTEVSKLIERFTQAPQLGILGQPRVNVLMINLALDALQGGQ